MKTFASIVLAAGLLSAPAFAQEQPHQTAESRGKILLVASSVNSLTFKDGRTHQTGYFLDELAVPAQAFLAAGYNVVVATPDGNTPALDGNSITEKLFQNDKDELAKAMRFVTTYPSMQKPERLADVVADGLEDFDALYIPGGHAPMVDLMQSTALGTALRYFHSANKVTAMLCHGPVAFTAAVSDPVAFRKAMVDGNADQAKALAAGWPYAGYNMTVYSTAEEIPTEDFIGGKIEFYMEDALRLAGANVTVAEPGKPYIVVDRELITGQNPYSDHMLADAVLKALDAQLAVNQ